MDDRRCLRVVGRPSSVVKSLALLLLMLALAACDVTGLAVQPTPTVTAIGSGPLPSAPVATPTIALQGTAPAGQAIGPTVASSSATKPVGTAIALPTEEVSSTVSVSPTPTLLPASERGAVFERVWQSVDDHYLYPDFHGAKWSALHGEYKPKVLAAKSDSEFYGLMADMIGRLNDDHSRYLSPSEAREEDNLINGHADYVGIGVIYQTKPDHSHLVAYVFPDSPAWNAGIRRRDLILAVNGQPYTGSPEDASKVRGPAGTPVTITVRSPGQQPRDLSIVRGKVTTGIVPTAERLEVDPTIGYLVIPSIEQTDMGKQVEQALTQLLQNGPPLKGLVIDLRGNGGGLRTVLTGILGDFVTGQVGQFFSQDEQHPLVINKGKLYDEIKSVPLIVLADKTTESYAEVLAAVLQSQGRARVVGVPSAGNTETIYPYNLADGSRLWIAQEGFKLSNGANLEGRGVIPDVTLDVDWTNYPVREDTQILKAVEMLRE